MIKTASVFVAFATIAISVFYTQVVYAATATYNVVTQYGADNTGVTDSTASIQSAVNAAIANQASYTSSTVLLPAGTYLIAGGANHNQSINIIGSNNLIFTGAGTASTMVWFTRANACHFLYAYNNTNLTIQNLSSDVQQINNKYDLGILQGTITSINGAADQITVAPETGYPLLNRPDFQGKTSNYTLSLWLQTDPARNDLDSVNLSNIAGSGDGSSAVLTLGSIPSNMHVGEKWCIYASEGGLWCDMGYGNTGTTTIQNVNYYGAGAGTMGNMSVNSSGAYVLNNIYSGSPSNQPDRLIASSGGWTGNFYKGSLTVSNSTFLRTWDDVFDIGTGEASVIGQPAANQIVVADTNSGNYQAGDSVEIADDTNAPYGTLYGQCTITAAVRYGSTKPNGDLITLSQNVSVHNIGKDWFTDLTQAGPITATNDTFNSAAGRHVYFRSGSSVTVQNCTFENDTLFQPTGWDGSEGPSECRNVTVTGCTFIGAAGITVRPDFGNWTAVTCSNVKITNNKFLNGGYYGQIAVSNTSGATIANNWFDNDYANNVSLLYDATVALNNNTFLHPNEVATSGGSSVISLKNVAGANLSGNLVYSPGPFTNYLARDGGGNSGINGLTNGIIDIDNPLAFYLSYDGLVMDRPSTGSILDQAAWTGGANQKWQALPTYSNPGLFTINDSGNGKYVGNGTSLSTYANIVEENQAWTTSTSQVPVAEQLWSLAYIDGNTSNIIDSYSGYDINVTGSNSAPGTQLIQYYAGSSQNQNFYTVAPPALVATSQFGTINLNWATVPYATSYNVGRSTTAGGSYATIASNLATTSYTDSNLTSGTAYYYVVTANGLSVSNNKSNEAAAVFNANYVPVNIAPEFNITGIEPNAWVYNGYGYDNWQSTYSGSLVGKYITANGCLLNMAPSAVPDAVSDQGQRVVFPGGLYSSLQFLGGYVSGGAGSTGTFQPTLTYSDGSRVALSQGMTNWCGPHSQTGEMDAATYASRNLANGTSQTVTNYVHAYTVPIDSTRQPIWLDLPSTGNFRILAMDLAGANKSVLAPGQNLLPGQYIASPSGVCFLTMQADGNLVLYNGSSPANEGSAFWASGTYGDGTCYAAMQTDSNFVIYQGTPTSPGTAVWGSGTYGNAVTALQVTDSKEVQIVNGTTVVWQKP